MFLETIEFVDVVETYEINNGDDVKRYFIDFISSGYEGAILRKDSIYEHKRSKNLLKYKEFMEEEFEIIDICDGKTNGIAEYAWIRLGDGKNCKSTLAFSDKECAEMLLNKEKYIGKFASVRFFGYTNDGMLRFPVLKSIRDYE